MWSKKIIIIPFILLILTGCSVVPNDNPILFSGTRDYEMKIIKSEVNINDLDFSAEKNLTTQDLLDKSQVNYVMNGNGKLKELDGVIATASREWKVYVDNIEADLNSTVCDNCEVEWRYENKVISN